MREISFIAKRRLEFRLEDLDSRMEELRTNLAEAKEKGDLSENEEYTAALSEYTKAVKERAGVVGTLEVSRVKQSYSSNISVGSLIEVKELNPDGKSVKEDLGLLLFDEEGSALFSGIVSKNSNLGRAIFGGIGGEYLVKDIRGIDQKFSVTLEPESRTDEYLEKYPPDPTKVLDKIFEGI